MIEETLINDLFLRQKRLQRAIREAETDGIFLTSDVNIFYMTGTVFGGYYYLPAEGDPALFVRRPESLSGERLYGIRKTEQLPNIFKDNGLTMPKKICLETDKMSYNECVRLQNCFDFTEIVNASTMMSRIRMLKTPYEISRFRISAQGHAATYSKIQDCYREGMTDLQFQVEIERVMRLNGSFGIFKTSNANMNIFMGSILTGDNAATPSPYDFALGGGGQSPLCPIGANGTLLRKGMAVMVDMVGNYTEYLTDMTRVFAVGKLPEEAYRAHQTSLEIQSATEATAMSGVACAELWDKALAIADKAGLADCFMGAKQKAKFVGHGIGLEIDEPPVLTPRSKDILKSGMTFALEPKFVIAGVGAVGIENSFLVTETGLEKLTVFPEEIIELA
ncbi:MAG: Xaa-Pro peptidase family protein [Tannerella sp.]|jgi:Xaa-Pro aminopeptidase|nr:Xaa-Pro peptidase family protein [Tannerella sp.]